jgi:hypothetical protein
MSLTSSSSAGGLAPPADFEAAVRAAVMQSGGWNRESRLRVSALAAAMGKNQADLHRALLAVGTGGVASVAGVASQGLAAPSVVPAMKRIALPATEDESRPMVAAARGLPARWGARRIAIVGAMVCMVVAVFVMSRALVLRRGSPVVGATEALDPTAEPAAIAAVPTAPLSKAGQPEMEVSLPTATAPVTPRPVVEPGPRVEVSKPQPVTRRTGGVLSRWEAAALELRGEVADRSPDERLTRAIRLARMNTAASLAWAGDLKSAEGMIEDVAASGPSPGKHDDLVKPVHDGGNVDDAAGTESLTGPGGEADGQLALQIIAARRQPGAAVESLARRRFGHEALGPADCDAVAECALYGSPLDLRLVCKKIVIEQRGYAAMVHALLEALPRAAAQPHVSEIIAEVSGRRLPSSSDAAWPAAARGALVARLAELLSSKEEGLDGLVSSLMLAYAADGGAAAEPSGVEGGASGDDAASLERQAQRRWERWREAASKQGAESAVLVAVERLTRRRDLRLMLAAGPVQRFVAWQLSTIDAMSFVVGREQPSLAGRIEAVVAEGAKRVRDAADALTQVAEGERTMMRLWLLRVGNPAEASGAKEDGA